MTFANQSIDEGALYESVVINKTEADAGRNALRGAMAAFFVDAFDAYVPVLALAPAAVYFLPLSIPPALRATLAYVVFFTLSWMGRPIGAFIFGHYGDTIGRRKTVLIAIGGFGFCTFLMGLMPGYAAGGYLSLTCFGILRLVGGVFLGGEYTGASPLALEYAPKEKRGLWGSLCNIGYPSALAAITALTYLVMHIFPAGGPSAPYSLWGWRVAFMVGSCLALILFVYYYRNVEESEVWQTEAKAKMPIVALMSGGGFARFAQVFVLMLGCWLTLNSVAGSLATFLHVTLGVPSLLATGAIFISTLLGASLFPVIGVAGQRVGRKTMFILLGCVNIVITPAAYAWLAASAYQSPTLVIALTIVLQIPTLALWALVTAYITESFPTRVRASGYGLGFSLSTIPAAFYAVGMLAMSRYMPYKFTQIPILMLGGALICLGAFLGHDNRQKEFSEE